MFHWKSVLIRFLYILYNLDRGSWIRATKYKFHNLQRDSNFQSSPVLNTLYWYQQRVWCVQSTLRDVLSPAYHLLWPGDINQLSHVLHSSLVPDYLSAKSIPLQQNHEQAISTRGCPQMKFALKSINLAEKRWVFSHLILPWDTSVNVCMCVCVCMTLFL